MQGRGGVADTCPAEEGGGHSGGLGQSRKISMGRASGRVRVGARVGGGLALHICSLRRKILGSVIVIWISSHCGPCEELMVRNRAEARRNRGNLR